MSALEILFLGMEDVIAAGGLDMAMTMDTIEKTLSLFDKGECILPDKTVLKWGKNYAEEMKSGRINIMPGYVGGDYNVVGVKWISSNPDNPFIYNLPRASALIILNDMEKKYPFAIMDGTIISAMRTGAITGIAAKYLARKDSSIVGLIGAGVQNRTQLKAILETMKKIEKVFIYDLYRERSDKFALEMSKDLAVNIIPVDTAEAAIAESDIVVTATMTSEPIVMRRWLKKGSFYSNVSGFECDYDTVKLADKRVVDTWSHVKHRLASTISLMSNKGLISDSDIHAELGQIINGKKTGRTSEDEIIYFNSVGMAIEDVAEAMSIYRQAYEKNIGTKLKLWENPLWF
jgi:ornithine cyclodeaminase